MSSKQNGYLLSKDKVYNFIKSREPESTTIQDVMDHFGSNYRTTASILKRMTEGIRPLISREKDGRTWHYYLTQTKIINPEELLRDVLNKAKQPEYIIDKKVKGMLKQICERDGGLMPNYSIRKSGKHKGKRKRNGGFAYIITTFLELASEFNYI